MADNREYAVNFFQKHMKEDVLRYGERQAIHIALEALKSAEPQTNADRIRSMSDEELAEVVSTTCPTKGCPLTAWDCTECWLNWLKQPVKDGDNE